jgi:hypothetical protein
MGGVTIATIGPIPGNLQYPRAAGISSSDPFDFIVHPHNLKL